jgi:hypothetical protein
MLLKKAGAPCVTSKKCSLWHLAGLLCLKGMHVPGGAYSGQLSTHPRPPPPPTVALLPEKLLRVALSSVQPSHCRPPPPCSPTLPVNFVAAMTICCIN